MGQLDVPESVGQLYVAVVVALAVPVPVTDGHTVDPEGRGQLTAPDPVGQLEDAPEAEGQLVYGFEPSARPSRIDGPWIAGSVGLVTSYVFVGSVRAPFTVAAEMSV